MSASAHGWLTRALRLPMFRRNSAKRSGSARKVVGNYCSSKSWNGLEPAFRAANEGGLSCYRREATTSTQISTPPRTEYFTRIRMPDRLQAHPSLSRVSMVRTSTRQSIINEQQILNKSCLPTSTNLFFQQPKFKHQSLMAKNTAGTRVLNSHPPILHNQE